MSRLIRPHVVAIATLGLNALHLSAADPRAVLPPPGTGNTATVPQNWTDAESAWFYAVPQGSKLMPYGWFLNLEQASSEVLFRDAANIQALGYLARTAGAGNPDGLPVGFARDDDHLGFTCAACHTQQIVYQDTAWLIDGAPTLADFETFLRTLTTAARATVDSDAKFARFADRVLGAGGDAAARTQLKGDLTAWLTFRDGYNARNLSRAPEMRFGPGRVDAIGAIFNEVSSTAGGLPDNHLPADAPVSYPFLWDTPQHDFVQWNGAVANVTNLLAEPIFGTKHIGALGRNTGEVLGVFGTYTVAKDVILPRGYPSSVNLANLIQIEDSLRKLWSPQWPAGFPPIDPAKRDAGKGLFDQFCVQCHQPIDRTNPNREVRAWLDHPVGTDPGMARNFLTRRVRTGQFEGQFINVPGIARFKATAAQSELLVHSVKRVLIGGGRHVTFDVPFQVAGPASITLGDRRLRGRFLSIGLDAGKFQTGKLDPEARSISLQLKADGKTYSYTKSPNSVGRFVASDGKTVDLAVIAPDTVIGTDQSRLNLTTASPVEYIYKGRPLNGIWATAPYLHNGSVPNLDELLKKPGNRTPTFKVGSREFDPVRVGFRTDAGSFTFDTTVTGNANVGHDYGGIDGAEFTPEQRAALIEYMKSL